MLPDSEIIKTWVLHLDIHLSKNSTKVRWNLVQSQRFKDPRVRDRVISFAVINPHSTHLLMHYDNLPISSYLSKANHDIHSNLVDIPFVQVQEYYFYQNEGTIYLSRLMLTTNTWLASMLLVDNSLLLLLLLYLLLCRNQNDCGAQVWSYWLCRLVQKSSKHLN